MEVVSHRVKKWGRRCIIGIKENLKRSRKPLEWRKSKLNCDRKIGNEAGKTYIEKKK